MISSGFAPAEKYLAQEVGVFEVAEQADVRAQADQQRHTPVIAFLMYDPKRGEVIDSDQAQDEEDELRFPRHVKEEARGQQQIAPPRPRHRIEQREDDNQKRDETEGGEQQAEGGGLI